MYLCYTNKNTSSINLYQKLNLVQMEKTQIGGLDIIIN